MGAVTVTSLAHLNAEILEAFFSEDARATLDDSPSVPLAELDYLNSLYVQSGSMQRKVANGSIRIAQSLALVIDVERFQAMQAVLLFMFSEGLRTGWFTRSAVQEAVALREIYAKSEGWDGWEGVCP